MQEYRQVQNIYFGIKVQIGYRKRSYLETVPHLTYCVPPLIRVNPGSIFGWGLIFIFGGLVNLFFKF
jgi:hypothetical protein